MPTPTEEVYLAARKFFKISPIVGTQRRNTSEGRGAKFEEEKAPSFSDF